MIVEMANYLSGCPHLSGRQVCVNYLAEAEDSVSLEISGSREAVREYADGGVMKGVTFTLAIRDNFGISQPESCKIAQSCRQIEKWIEEQNLIGNLPLLSGKERSVSVGVKNCFKVTQTKDFSARYEAEIELIYYNPA